MLSAFTRSLFGWRRDPVVRAVRAAAESGAPVSVGGRRPLRILYYGGAVDYAGTWRGHERLLGALDRRRFDPHVFYWPGDANTRIDSLIALLGAERVIAFERSATRGHRRRGCRPRWSNFGALARALSFDIVHVARSGHYEWPFIERMAPLHVETNVFGERDRRGVLDRSIAPCEYVASLRGGADAIAYTPIPRPERDGETLRARLGIPAGAIVAGRIGRPANFTPIALDAFARLAEEIPGALVRDRGAVRQDARSCRGVPDSPRRVPAADRR